MLLYKTYNEIHYENRFFFFFLFSSCIYFVVFPLSNFYLSFFISKNIVAVMYIL